MVMAQVERCSLAGDQGRAKRHGLIDRVIPDKHDAFRRGEVLFVKPAETSAATPPGWPRGDQTWAISSSARRLRRRYASSGSLRHCRSPILSASGRPIYLQEASPNARDGPSLWSLEAAPLRIARVVSAVGRSRRMMARSNAGPTNGRWGHRFDVGMRS
jgi:hypothetical protein